MAARCFSSPNIFCLFSHAYPSFLRSWSFLKIIKLSLVSITSCVRLSVCMLTGRHSKVQQGWKWCYPNWALQSSCMAMLQNWQTSTDQRKERRAVSKNAVCGPRAGGPGWGGGTPARRGGRAIKWRLTRQSMQARQRWNATNSAREDKSRRFPHFPLLSGNWDKWKFADKVVIFFPFEWNLLLQKGPICLQSKEQISKRKHLGWITDCQLSA